MTVPEDTQKPLPIVRYTPEAEAHDRSVDSTVRYCSYGVDTLSTVPTVYIRSLVDLWNAQGCCGS
jgi:hypothetical protein